MTQINPCNCSKIKTKCIENWRDHRTNPSHEHRCRNARKLNDQSDTFHNIECTPENCSIVGDCGNRYRPTLTVYHIDKTTVAMEQFTNGITMKGLKVREGEEIPEWGVIGEYTGEWSKNRNKNSTYTILIAPRYGYIDATHKGNTTRFINNRCENPNAGFVPVQSSDGTKNTMFVRAIRKIVGGEFIVHIHKLWGWKKNNLVNNNCLCIDCAKKKPSKGKL